MKESRLSCPSLPFCPSYLSPVSSSYRCVDQWLSINSVCPCCREPPTGIANLPLPPHYYQPSHPDARLAYYSHEAAATPYFYGDEPLVAADPVSPQPSPVTALQEAASREPALVNPATAVVGEGEGQGRRRRRSEVTGRAVGLYMILDLLGWGGNRANEETNATSATAAMEGRRLHRTPAEEAKGDEGMLASVEEGEGQARESSEQPAWDYAPSPAASSFSSRRPAAAAQVGPAASPHRRSGNGNGSVNGNAAPVRSEESGVGQ